MLHVFIIEALLATLVADIFAATGASSGDLEILCNGLHCELRILCVIEHNNIRSSQTAVAAIHASLQVKATSGRERGAIPLFTGLVHVAFLARRLAAGPIRILHVARVRDHLTALGRAAICGAIRFAVTEMLAVIFFQACVYARVHWATSIKRTLDALQEEILGRDNRREQRDNANHAGLRV
jgi:hypothetical protein